MRPSSITFASCVAFTQLAAGQSSQFLPSNPGGAVPANVQAPSIAGFMQPTIQPSRGGLAVCVSGLVPVYASAMNLKLNYPTPQNQSVVTQTFLSMLTTNGSFVKQLTGGTHHVNGTYTIGATYCTPANNTKPDTVEILTHGIGFDRYYWDFAPGYSYVDVATQYNHATFFYDRLGVGKSSTPDPISVVQTPLELEILHQLVNMLKSGYFSNSTFSTFVGTGHSFGSILTQGLIKKYPDSFNTTILTGFSLGSSGQQDFFSGMNPAIAAQNQPYRFNGLNSGYFVAASTIANQFAFLHAQNFDPEILNLAEATKGSIALGQIFTQTAITGTAANYTGAVAVVNGDMDLPFCDANCTYPSNYAQAALSLLPKAGRTGTYLAPFTGHGLNLHYSAVAAYHYIQNFILNSTAS